MELIILKDGLMVYSCLDCWDICGKNCKVVSGWYKWFEICIIWRNNGIKVFIGNRY